MATKREENIESFENDVVSAEEAVQGFQYNLPVRKVEKIANGYLSDIYEIESEDDEYARESLYSLLSRFFSQTQQSGTANDYHNFAVALARKSEYALACQVLECGLKMFPKNVDLLADFLQYGVLCDRLDDCKKYHKVLLKIPRRRWTWRGFAFLVDYLRFLNERSDSEKEIAAREAEMLEVASEFRTFYPYVEEPYSVEANIFKDLNEHEKELGALQSALENLEVAPKCALRCADILFERGKYSEAAEKIRRCISDANRTQSSVSEGYMYYLSALCKIANTQKSESTFDEASVIEIYSDFNIALKDLSGSSYVEVIKTKTNMLVNKTGVDVSSEYELLYDCAAY